MHPELLFAAIRRRLFVPVRLHVSDGSTYDVRHPDAILVTRNSVILALPGGGEEMPERSLILAPVHITRIEDLAAAPAGDASGS
jgi:hypothetical protein